MESQSMGRLQRREEEDEEEEEKMKEREGSERGQENDEMV